MTPPNETTSDNSSKGLTRVPLQMLEMTDLRMLFMDRNELTHLPVDFFEKLPYLHWLDLRDNQLECIPEGIAGHKCLETLLLQNNSITKLPNELANLKVLQLAGNPLEYPSADVIERGVSAICAFLKQNSLEDFPNSFNAPSATTFRSACTSKKLKPARKPCALPTPLTVTGLSTKERSYCKVSRSVSKVSTCSRKSWNTIETAKQDKRIAEERIRERWMEKLRELIEDQEKILQQEKTLERLSSWRDEKKQEPQRCPCAELRRLPAKPFDTNPIYNRLMSRSAVVKHVERLIALQHSDNKRRGEGEDLDRLISDVIFQLKTLEKRAIVGNDGTELKNADEEIRLIINLHKRIAQIQAKNNFR